MTRSPMIRKWLAILTPLLLALVGCSKGSGGSPDSSIDGVSVGNGMHLRMAANLSHAISLTTTIPSRAAGDSRRLLKVTDSHSLEDVLNGPHHIEFWKETPTHIIAQVDIYENGQSCHLIAIPKVQGTTQVLCLSRDPLSQRLNVSRPRFDVQGVEVYFTTAVERRTNQWSSASMTGVSELRYWNGVSESVRTIYHTDEKFNRNPMLDGVFASETNDNLCFSYGEEAYGSATSQYLDGQGHMFCRTGKDKRWKMIPEAYVLASTLKFNNELLFEEHSRPNKNVKFSLETLTFSDRKGPLPLTREFDLEDGGFIGRGDWRGVWSAVTCVDRHGDGKLVAEVNARTTLVRNGSWAWFWGTQSLQRVNLRDCALDGKNYFTQTTLLQLSGLSWALGDFLRVDGMTDAGVPGTVHLDALGRFVTRATQPVTIDHPIELKWKL